MGFRELQGIADLAVRQQLGDTVTYSPGSRGLSSVVVSGVFDAAYQFVDAGNAGVSSSGPAVFLTLSDLPSDPSDDHDATVTFQTVVYEIRESQPDGLGGCLLLLHKT